MDPALNPYTPGSGRKPPSLQGRDHEIEAFDLLVARAKSRKYGRGMVLHGLRGVGKTALLTHLRGHAEHHGWYTVVMEAQSSSAGARTNHRQLASSLRQGLRRYSRKHAFKQGADKILSLIEGSSLSVAGVSMAAPSHAGEDVAFDIEEIIESIGEAVRSTGTALAIFIDEMQDLDQDLMSALVVAQHRANQEDWPFYVIGAGLPSLPSVLAEARSYAERLFLYRTIGPLDHAQACHALSDPSESMGGSFSPDALELIVQATEGYPYFLQEFGSAVWDVAPRSPFTRLDAEAAIDIGTEQLDHGFFPSRWDRATPAERKYLRAIADTGEAAPRTATLSITQNAAGPHRASLIDKGIIYAPERGRISFTVPGMAAFIARQHED